MKYFLRNSMFSKIAVIITYVSSSLMKWRSTMIK